MNIVTINVQNVYHWLTHMSAVACCSLPKRCQWFSTVRQTKLTKVHFKTRELVLTFIAACVKTPALPPNFIIQWLGELKQLIISNEVKAIRLVETQNLKR